MTWFLRVQPKVSDEFVNVLYSIYNLPSYIKWSIGNIDQKNDNVSFFQFRQISNAILKKSKPFLDLGIPPLNCKSKSRFWKKNLARGSPLIKGNCKKEYTWKLKKRTFNFKIFSKSTNYAATDVTQVIMTTHISYSKPSIFQSTVNIGLQGSIYNLWENLSPKSP